MADTAEKDKDKKPDTSEDVDDSEDNVSDSADDSPGDDVDDTVSESKDDAEDSKDTKDSADSSDDDIDDNKGSDEDDTDDTESDSDDSADYGASDNDEGGDDPNEVASKSALIFDALSDASENYEDDTHVVQSNTSSMDSDWSALMEQFVKESSINADIQNRSRAAPALESLTISSFGFVSIKHVLDEEMRYLAKGYIDKLPAYLSGQIQNCLALANQGLSSVNEHIKTFKSRIDKKEKITTSFTWGANSRQFMCAGVSLDTMPKLLSVANQQMIVHQHIAKEGCDHFVENAAAVLTFLKNVKEDTAWPTELNALCASLAAADKKIEVSQEYLLRRTDPDSFVPKAPLQLRLRKSGATGKALVAMLDSVVYCRHTPITQVNHLSQLIQYGISIERDVDAEKNPSSGIDYITNEHVLSLLLIAKKTLEVVKSYESNLVRMTTALSLIAKQYSAVTSYRDYHLSKQKREELLYVGIYLTEIVTNPHIASMWQAMRLVHASLFLTNQLLPQEQTLRDNFEGFKMKQTKMLMAALEQAVDVPNAVSSDQGASRVIGEAENDPVNALNGMDVHPDDQQAIDDSVAMTQDSNQLGNSVTALEGLRQSCKQMIKYGTPQEQRQAISNINANHLAICMGLGISSPPTVALESSGGEEVALEGLFSAIGDTISNVVQSVKNMWNNWMTKIQENRLRSKAAAGNMWARLELIKRKKHLLIEAAGQTYTNKNTLANLGLYGKINTPKLALNAIHNLHADYSQYVVNAVYFADSFYSSLKRNTPNDIRQSIADQVISFQTIVFPEKRNPHAVAPRLIKDQEVHFAKPIPGNSAMALITPNELFNESYRGDRVDEVSYIDLSSGIRRDQVDQIEAATEENFLEVSDAIGKWIALVDDNADNWGRVISGANNAGELAEYVYQKIQGRDEDAADAARMYYRYLAHFLPQVLAGLAVRSALTQTVFAASMTWMEESILKAEEIIKSRPSVGV